MQDIFSNLADQVLSDVGQPSSAENSAGDAASAIFQVAQERGIDPAHLLGLAKLETRAGEKTVKGGGADTRNLFNVKNFSNGNEGIRARDKAEGSNDRYRSYGSYRESTEDLVSLLERKYPGALKAGSPEEFARELKRGGYATDPDYESKLARVIRSSGNASRPSEQPQEWDQGASYAPVGVDGVSKPGSAEKPSKRSGILEGAADAGISAAQGVAGSFKALTDLAGADNAASRGLDDASKGMEKFKSEASQADRQYHQQKIKEAEASGDWKTEVAAYANMVWDMPLESVAQAVGSFATLGAGKVAQMAKLASAAKKAGVAKEAFLKTTQGIEAAKKASSLGAKVNVGLGVGQGVGGVKGSQYEQTYNAAKESGLSEEQAQTLATEAQSYQQGWGQQLVGAGLGYVASKTGPVEKLASGQTVGAGGVARRFVGGGLVEAGTEGLQGGQERYAGNAAAIDAGVLDSSKQWAGVAGSGASEAITAGILGGGAGALGRPDVDLQAQAKAAAQKSGGIVSRAGLAATPGAQQPNPAAPNRPAASPAATAAPGTAGNTAAAAPSGASAAAGAPNPYFDGVTDKALESMGSHLATRQTMTDGTPITEADRQLGRDALAELQRRRLAAKAGPQPVAGQTQIQASALSAIEQALEVDKQRRRAAGEVVDDEVEEVDVVAAQPAATTVGPIQPVAPQTAPTQPAAKPPLSNERDSMLPQALDVLRQGGRPSISSIQRGLKIGYNRAARILEDMERNGVVSPMDATGMRQVLSMPAPLGAQPTQPTQPASAGFSSPKFDNSPIPKIDPAAADEQRRQFAEFEQKRKNRRAGTRSAAWERNPFMAFLGANGLNHDTAGEFASGLTERRKAFVPGYGPVFRPGAKNLDELVQTAREDGFLRDDDGEPELYDLIDRALRGERIAPLYADGAAEAEGQRRQQVMQEQEGATFEDYLAQQRAEMESDDFDPFTPMAESGYDDQDLDGTDFNQADDDVRAEVAALSAHYTDMGFDPSDVLERLALENENQPEQQFYDLAKTRLFQLIEQAQSQAEPAGNGDPRADDAQPAPAREEGGQGQAAAVTPPATPVAAQPKRADAIRAKLDDLKAQGFSQFTRSGGRTLLLNPDTYETVELTPAEKAVAKVASSQAKAGLQSLRGQRKPAQVDQQGVDVLQSYSPADVLAQEERAGQQQAAEQAGRDKADAQAQADDERKRVKQASYAAADSFELGQNPLDSLTGRQDIFGAAPVAQGLAGEKINDEWTAFDPQSGTLGIPRSEMPQIKAEHHGAMMGFLKARGIDGQQETIPSKAIKPTQAEFSPAKVQQAIDREGGSRSIIVSADGYVVDGHHQWLAAREKGEPIQAIRLDQNIDQVLAALKDMPSAQPEDAKAIPSAEPALTPSRPVPALAQQPSALADASQERRLKMLQDYDKLVGSTRVADIDYRLVRLQDDLQIQRDNPNINKQDQQDALDKINQEIGDLQAIREAAGRRDSGDSSDNLSRGLLRGAKSELDIALASGQISEGEAQDLVESARQTGSSTAASEMILDAIDGRDAPAAISGMQGAQLEVPAIDASPTAKWRKSWGEARRTAESLGLPARDGKRNLKLTEMVPAIEARLGGANEVPRGGESSANPSDGNSIKRVFPSTENFALTEKYQTPDERTSIEQFESGRDSIKSMDEVRAAIDLQQPLPPELASRLQEAHKSHGRDVKRSIVLRSLNMERQDQAGTPKTKRERADRISRLEADLALFDGGKPAKAPQATTGQPDPALAQIFDQLDGRTDNTQNKGKTAAAAHPQAERIQLVRDNFHDILTSLMDSGRLKVNGYSTVTEENKSCL